MSDSVKNLNTAFEKVNKINLTSKVKKLFEEWYVKTQNRKILSNDRHFWLMTHDYIPLNEQWGVLQDFAGYIGYEIMAFYNGEHRDGYAYQIFKKIDAEIVIAISGFETRDEARRECIKSLNIIVNKL